MALDAVVAAAVAAAFVVAPVGARVEPGWSKGMQQPPRVAPTSP